MSRALLQKVITDGVDGNLNDFFLSVSNYYTEKDDDLADYNDERFANFKGIGEINFEDGQKLVVVTADTTRDLTERSGKKDQYEKAKRILKFYTRYDAGIFVFSDANDNFRLSLVYATPDATRTVWSNFRRFTYYASRTLTNKTFLDRVGTCSFASLNTIKNAFSVEKVTRDFYRQIADWYFWAVQKVTFPKDAEAEVNGRNNAVIRLITRLIFIWFMKERRLVSPDLFNQEKIAAFLKSLKPDESTYYKAILQNLFFATLNTKIEGRQFRFAKSYKGRNKDYMEHGIYRYEDHFKNQEDMLVIFRDIPFLNGGLFDCLDWSAKESGTGTEVLFDGFSDKEVGLNVPNHLFFSSEKEVNLNQEYGTKNKKCRVQGLLNTLQAYNFTIDENDRNDQEVALDPELLGKVFENLLASFNPETATTARKATGSYYTPREIVDYMVTQSLKQYYKTNLSDVANIENKLEELLSPTTEEPLNPFAETDSKRIVKLTEELRIVDPAVGSGAFPMGILNKLVSVLSRVDHNNRLWQEAQLKAVEGVTDQLLKQKLIKQINEQFTEKNSNYGRKLYLLQKCIYGVDIQQIAIEIAKLRFFIALLVDENIDKSKPNWGIEPLPNLDFKLMQGNSLISEFMGINLDTEDTNSYGKLMRNETEELITEFQNKKSEHQYEPDRDKKEALKNEIEKLIARIFESKLQSQKAEYFTKLKIIERKYASVSNVQQRNESIREDTEILNKNYKFDLAQAERQLKAFTRGQKVKPFFAWKLYFAEVFHEKSGFDIVIANPPYGYRDVLTPEEKQYFRKVEKIAFSSGDSAELFSKKSFDKLVKDGGILTFVIPKKSLYGDAWEGFRIEYWKKFELIFLLDVSKAFDEVLLEQNVFSLVKSKNNTPIELCYLTSDDVVCKFAKVLKDNIFMPNNTVQIYKALYSESIFKKIQSLSVNEHLFEGELGLAIGTDFYSDKPTDYKLLKGIDIERWKIKQNRYLKNKHKLNWDDAKKFLSPKVISQRVIAHINNPMPHIKLISCYDNEGIIITNTVISFNLSKSINPKFWTTYLNSSFLSWYAYNFIYSRAIRTMDFYNFYIQQLPLPKQVIDVAASQKPFIELYDQIFAITKEEDYFKDQIKQAKVRELESQIDQMVYELYGLTPEEIGVVEGKVKKETVQTEGKQNKKEEAQVEIILTKDKETPGTWRYKEQKEDHPLTIYLTKEQVNELGSPESIKITVTAA